jgi:hypothetical protein
MWMLRCEEVTRKVSESMDRQLPLLDRLMIWMHVLMCHLCFRYKMQLQQMRMALATEIPTEIPKDQSPDEDAALSAEAKDRMKERLRQELNSKLRPA